MKLPRFATLESMVSKCPPLRNANKRTFMWDQMSRIKKKNFQIQTRFEERSKMKERNRWKTHEFFIFPFWKLLLTFKHIFFRLTLKLHVFMLQRFGNLFKHEHSWFSFWKFIFLVSKWQLYFFILIPALSLRLRASLRWPKPWFQIFFNWGSQNPLKEEKPANPNAIT